MITNGNKKDKKTSHKFVCKKCDYITHKVGNWNRHILTRKHKISKTSSKKEPKGATTYECNRCGRIYKFQSGLSRHYSKCSNTEITLVKSDEESEPDISTSLLIALNKLVKANVDAKNDSDNFKLLNVLNELSELKKLVKNNIEPTIVNNNNTTNTQNISINMFLNDYCKDAMNLKDFMRSLKLSINDLCKTQELGFVGGISNIFIKNLSDIPSIKRPIHCSDTKRMLFYVKEEDGWNKDGGNKVAKAIEDVTLQQIKTLHDWETENPNYLENPVLLGEWNNLVHNIMGGSSKEERTQNKNLIKTQVGETMLIKDARANLK